VSATTSFSKKLSLLSSTRIPSGGPSGTASKNDEEEELEVSVPLSQSGSVNKDRDAPLLRDIELLSDIFSDIVNAEDPVVHDLYEEFRQYGLERAAEASDTKALQKMVDKATQLTPDQAVGVMRTFSIMLNLVNSAEVQHRNRLMRLHELKIDVRGGPLPLTEDSMRGTMDSLLKSGLATKDQIYEQLLKQKVEIVLTAHPTQVQRKSLLRKYSQITDLLAMMERTDLTAFEKTNVLSDLRRIVSSILGADEIKRAKPTPQQEATGGNAVLESVLWDAVPAYLRKLDSQIEITLGRRLPVDAVPIKFASWIGGDRDGMLPVPFRTLLLFHCLSFLLSYYRKP
jgi:phosphoenolpyruvate carboxylase